MIERMLTAWVVALCLGLAAAAIGGYSITDLSQDQDWGPKGQNVYHK
jgi:hypothetical protein